MSGLRNGRGECASNGLVSGQLSEKVVSSLEPLSSKGFLDLTKDDEYQRVKSNLTTALSGNYFVAFSRCSELAFQPERSGLHESAGSTSLSRAAIWRLIGQA